jgi:hypothetical protein
MNARGSPRPEPMRRSLTPPAPRRPGAEDYSGAQDHGANSVVAGIVSRGSTFTGADGTMGTAGCRLWRRCPLWSLK